MSRYVIGLTGGISCGKSNLSSALKKAGAHVVDADEISRNLTRDGGEALPQIRKAFGDACFQGSSLDRKALAGLVFGNEENRNRLNAILHPLILRAMKKEMDDFDGITVLDVPLLYECGMDKWCDEVWCAYIPQKEQVKRLCARDGLTKKEALLRIRAQMPALQKARLADRVIRTAGTPKESADAVLALWRETRQRLEKEKSLA